MISSSELDRTVKAYLIECIDFEGSINEKVTYARDTFQAECGWNVSRVGQQQAVQDWLQGLCSAVTIVFYNDDILALALLWGSLSENATEKEEGRILDNYWQLMAAKLCQLFNKVK